MKNKKIMIVAGEASGDLQAAYLVKALKSIDPNLEIYGAGGKKMGNSGVEIIYDIVELAVVGFVEVLKNFWTFRNIFRELTFLLEKRRPDAVILIDYPGFNIRFARAAKEKNIPVIYYISPQVWAWGKNRIKEIKKFVDRMIVIFNFEEILYKEAGVNVDFVGHPFLDIVKPEWKKEETIKRLGLRPDSIKIALLPGSRLKEIEQHLGIMLRSCEIIKKHLPDTEFLLSKIKELDNRIYDRIISFSKIKPYSLENRPYETIDVSDLVIVSSGSATLETAIMEKPMVIIYKTSLITWLLVKNMIKIPDIGLVNIVAGRRVVPELVQFKVNPENIAKEVLNILNNKKLYENIKEDLKKVGEKLGKSGATERAANIILKHINSC